MITLVPVPVLVLPGPVLLLLLLLLVFVLVLDGPLASGCATVADDAPFPSVFLFVRTWTCSSARSPMRTLMGRVFNIG